MNFLLVLFSMLSIDLFIMTVCYQCDIVKGVVGYNQLMKKCPLNLKLLLTLLSFVKALIILFKSFYVRGDVKITALSASFSAAFISRKSLNSPVHALCPSLSSW